MIGVNLGNGYKLVDRVYEQLRAAILKGELLPGTRLVEAEVAKLLGVSRSPVREAITRLEHEGLVSISSLKVIVREVPASEVEDLFFVRAALEGMAASLATPRLTEDQLLEMGNLCKGMQECLSRGDFVTLSAKGDKFHDMFITASQNMKLKEMWTGVKEQIFRYRSLSAARPGRGGLAVREHQQILDAFQKRDAQLAECLVRDHVLAAKKNLLESA